MGIYDKKAILFLKRSFLYFFTMKYFISSVGMGRQRNTSRRKHVDVRRARPLFRVSRNPETQTSSRCSLFAPVDSRFSNVPGDICLGICKKRAIIFVHSSQLWGNQGTWPALDLLPKSLHSSVGRELHRYRGGHGFESRWSLRLFFWAFFATT